MDNNQNNNFNGNQDPNQNTGFNTANGGYTDPNQNWQQPQYQTPPQYTSYPPFPAQEMEPPMSIGQWILTLLVMMIPCVNLIMLFVWGFGGDPQKKSRANFCKAQLIMMAVVIVLELLLFVIFGSAIAALIAQIAGNGFI